MYKYILLIGLVFPGIVKAEEKDLDAIVKMLSQVYTIRIEDKALEKHYERQDFLRQQEFVHEPIRPYLPDKSPLYNNSVQAIDMMLKRSEVDSFNRRYGK